MLNSIKASAKDTLIYGLGNIAVKVVGFFLILLYTNPEYFSVDEFGIIGILEISGLLITAMIASGLPQSLTRWYWDRDFITSQKSIFFMAIVTQLVVSGLVCGILLLFSGSFSDMLFGSTRWTEVFSLVIISSGLQAINNIINTLMRLQSKAVLYSVTNLFKLGVLLAATFYLILGRKIGIEGIYLAQVIANLMFIIVLLLYALKNCSVSFNLKVFGDMSAYGFPLLLANVSAVALTVVDRYALNSLAPLKAVALYTLAYKVTSILKLGLADSLRLALSPIMMKKMNDPDNKRFYSKILLYTSFAMMAGVIFISLFSFEIIKVISKSSEFWSAVAIVPILSVSLFFMNMKDINIYSLHIVKKTNIIGVIIIITTVVSIALNLLLVPLWDITGTAVATLLSQIIYWAIVYFFSQKKYYIPYEKMKLLLILVAGSLLSFSSLLLNDMSLSSRILIKTLLFISYPFILYFLNFFEDVEINAIKGFIKKWKNLRNLRDNLKSLKNIGDISGI